MLCPFAVRRIFAGVVMELRRADFQGLLNFLVDVDDLEFDELYPVAFLARLQALVPCDELTYQESDLEEQRFYAIVGIEPDGATSDQCDDEELFWSVAPCPISQYRARTGDLAVLRMSDLVGTRGYHELPIFREYFRPAGLDHMIDVGLPTAPGRYRSFVLFRATGSRDFSDRERGVLEMLRPHLRRIEALAALRRRVSDELGRPARDGPAGAYTRLTPREREIVGLVAEGMTNAQIAAVLWVAPGTVKKHLEHVYEKIGASGRIGDARLVSTARAGLTEPPISGRGGPSTRARAGPN